ncbi:MAG TPA: nuclear transport factor 2 family protein, partial [Thermoleophilaceae bacterium]|nr:nuclear transport factor 2 family protein [Thermoleophilaceae bacterium]
MSRENVRVVLGVVEAWNAKDLERFVELLHPDIEWHDRTLFPDAGVHRGRAAVERHIREIAATVDLRWDVDETVDAGDSVVLCATLRGQGA